MNKVFMTPFYAFWEIAGKSYLFQGHNIFSKSPSQQKFAPAWRTDILRNRFIGFLLYTAGWEGTLLDDTKNSCVADWMQIKHWAQKYDRFSVRNYISFGLFGIFSVFICIYCRFSFLVSFVSFTSSSFPFCFRTLFLDQSGISLNLRTGPTGHATLFNQWEGALVFINKQIKTLPQWSKIFKTTDGVGQNQSSFRGSQAYF